MKRKTKSSGATYSDCEHCGGKVTEKRATLDLRIRRRLFEFENVPVGVCRECGHRVFKGPVLEQLERLAQNKSKIKKTIRVPVTEFEPAGAL